MTGPRILYVDDDAGIRRLAQRALERRGFAVTVAESADAGLAAIQEGDFDLVAVDNHMPGKSGREMLDDIVAMGEHPPVVFVTGNNDTSVAVDAIHAGALDFVVKTVGDSFFDLLDGRFRQALSRARLEREKREAEAELRAANERLELLVREVHHRVANSLQLVSSFVSMQANQTDEPAARAAFDATQSRIKAISKVHQNLYTRGDVTTIDLDEYLATLVQELGASLPQDSGEVQLVLDAEHVEVSPDSAISVGVIVNELVSNAAKYAFTDGTGGRIDVTLAPRDDGGYELTVGDDGVGCAEDASPQGTGFGMRVVGAIARSLGSELERVDVPKGCRQRLIVPGSVA